MVNAFSPSNAGQIRNFSCLKAIRFYPFISNSLSWFLYHWADRFQSRRIYSVLHNKDLTQINQWNLEAPASPLSALAPDPRWLWSWSDDGGAGGVEDAEEAIQTENIIDKSIPQRSYPWPLRVGKTGCILLFISEISEKLIKFTPNSPLFRHHWQGKLEARWLILASSASFLSNQKILLPE